MFKNREQFLLAIFFRLTMTDSQNTNNGHIVPYQVLPNDGWLL